MLRLQGGQVESLWDELLPEKLRELPDDLARTDLLLRDGALLAPIEAHWDEEAERRGRAAKEHGRPTIAMQTYVRLMVLKHRYGWGYTKPGARGFILPPATKRGNPGENELLPQTVAELKRLGLRPREVALDGGFQTNATAEALTPLAPERTFIAGRASAGSKRTQRRLTRCRVGVEGRISHLKRRHGLRRSRLKGGHGEHTWTGWAVFT